jgi:MYXO-CTERM domain-containing protein
MAADGWNFSRLPEGDGPGRLQFGTITGLTESTDGCTWTAATGAVVDRFITDTATAGGYLFAVSGNGSSENPLLWSIPGEPYEEGRNLPGARWSGVAADTAGNLWMAGIREGNGVVWWGPAASGTSSAVEGDGWRLVDLGTAPLGLRIGPPADGGLYVVVRGTSSSVLHFVTEAGSTVRLELPGDMPLLDAGPERGLVFAGGNEHGLLKSEDGGITWTEMPEAPLAWCMAHDTSHRYLCTDNWADGSAVRRVPLGDEGRESWESVIWFGDVDRVWDCPAGSDTPTICQPLWDLDDPLSGFDRSRADSGMSEKTEPGCSCSSTPPPSGLLVGIGLVMLVGRRRLSPRPCPPRPYDHAKR